MRQLQLLETELEDNKCPTDPLTNDEMALLQKIAGANEFETAIEDDIKLEVMAEMGKETISANDHITFDNHVNLRLRHKLKELREQLWVHHVRVRRLVQIIRGRFFVVRIWKF
jgi:hypothetical protein